MMGTGKRDARPAVFQVLSAEGLPCGAAFLLSETQLATCTHVVDQALRDGQHIACRDQQTGRQFNAAVREDWSTPSASSDLSVLELTEPINGVPIVPLGHSDLIEPGDELWSVGFPEATPDGKIALCRALGRTTVAGQPLIQVRSDELTAGFSGAPVWSDAYSVIVGIVMAFEYAPQSSFQRGLTTAFISGAERLREVCPVLTVAESPFRGLARFEPDHAKNYFGHELALASLQRSLRTDAGVALIGESGSGKSSLVRAGLTKVMPDIGMADWARIYTVPSRDPSESTVLALLSGAPPMTRVETTEPSALTLQKAVHAVLNHRPAGGILLVVDQLERLFTETPAPAQIDYLAAVHTLLSPRFKVLWVIRADYFERALRLPQLEAAVTRNPVILGRMSEGELRDVIRMPALQSGVAVENDLIEALVREVRNSAGLLPLLEFTLTELWSRDASTGVLRMSSFMELCGPTPPDVPRIAGVLARRAEAVVGAMGKEDRDLLPLITIRLVALPPSEAGRSSAPLIARRARKSEFSARTWEAAERLANSFILVTGRDELSGEPTLELAHEALIQVWPLMQRLTAGYLDFVRWYQWELVPRYEAWRRLGKKWDQLLPRSVLRQSRRWRGASDYRHLVEGGVREYLLRSRLRITALAAAYSLMVVALIGAAAVFLDGSHWFKEQHVKSRISHEIATFQAGGFGDVVAATYFRGWFQNFEFGRIIYVSASTGGSGLTQFGRQLERKAFVLHSPVIGSDRWFVDFEANPASLRQESIFCDLFRKSTPVRVAGLGFAQGQAVAKTCEELFRDGEADNLENVRGVTGSIAALYATLRLDMYLGVPRNQECQISGVVVRYQRGFALGGLPNDVCGPSDTYYFLGADRRSDRRVSAGQWQRRHLYSFLSSFYPEMNRRRAVDVVREWFSKWSNERNH
jgi:hypothetical protein